MSTKNNLLDLIMLKKPAFKTCEEKGNRKISTVVVEPLERGVGPALGYALKQVLVSSLPGAAINSVRIEGVSDESSTILGVCENVSEVISNIQKIELQMKMRGHKLMMIRRKGPGLVVAGDIQTTEQIGILNPDHIICTLDRDAEIRMELFANVGKGYESAEHKHLEGVPTGPWIPVDSHFSPVKKVSYKVEDISGGEFGYDKLTLTVETDGSITAEDAFIFSAQILQNQLSVLVEFEKLLMEKVDTTLSEIGFNPVLLRNVNELELSIRTAHILMNADIVYVGKLIQYSESELLGIPNFGRKSLNEIKEVLAEIGLHLETKVESWFSEDIETIPVLLKKVSDLELSERTSKCLMNADIVYVNKLIQLSESELLRLPNFGRKSLNEIKKFLAEMGLHLEKKVESWSSKDIEFIPVLLKKVNELNLAVRTSRCLENVEIVYLGDLIQWSESKLLRTPNFGRKSLNEIKEALAELGLHLEMKVDSWSPEFLKGLLDLHGDVKQSTY